MAEDKASAVLAACNAHGVMLASAESCTGGMIAAALTAVAGSSSVFERGFVTYTNQAKQDMLGVPAALFERVGAVSEDVARAMAEGALAHSRADVSVSVTGIAGPGGATPGKPVGLVHIAAARAGHDTRHTRFEFSGERGDVREQAVMTAFDMVLDILSS